MLPLVALLVAVCGVAMIGIADSTDLALHRTALQSSADAAALVGAESYDPLAAAFDGETVSVTLTDRRMRRAVRQFLADSNAGSRLVSATTPDGRTAFVSLRTDWQPPIASHLIPLHLVLRASASARSVLG